MTARCLAVLALLLACAAGPARAQDGAAPFDGELQRLAEILGGLHY
ncbi:TIGR02301 family protein, partial [Herbaspirillum sp. HC18]